MPASGSTTRRRPGNRLPRAACAALLLALAACSGSTDPAPTPASLADRLAAAKQKADDASSIHLVLTSRDVPGDALGVLGAQGVGTHAPAFKGTLTARLSGVQVDVDVVAIDGMLYLKFPFTPGYAKTDPDKYGAPDPATLFSRDQGITALLTATTDLAAADDTREGSEVLQQITGKLPGQQVVRLLHVGLPSQDYDVSYGLSATGELRKATLTGTFFPNSRSTYDVVLDRYGEPVDIQRP
ncbi:MAG: LppX_LprAFG lipoprotein [Austwickia sp.]|nr:LppX_LprAFG lipoprotein [Austwickia sp.]MBK8436533.1 LppX_LprAFG lipoprotein [Austwickia sp.]MBK9102211.1 LppX_LprAFG lipoprotein [Austwickia sp.]